MTDREQAIEAAAKAYREALACEREPMPFAIAAYEAALWRPGSEPPAVNGLYLCCVGKDHYSLLSPYTPTTPQTDGFIWTDDDGRLFHRDQITEYKLAGEPPSPPTETESPMDELQRLGQEYDAAAEMGDSEDDGCSNCGGWGLEVQGFRNIDCEYCNGRGYVLPAPAKPATSPDSTIHSPSTNPGNTD